MSSRRNPAGENKGRRTSTGQTRGRRSITRKSRSHGSRPEQAYHVVDRSDPLYGISPAAAWRGGSSSKRNGSGAKTNYNPSIAVIRETRGNETAGGKTVYIRRVDGAEEFLSTVTDFTGYNLNQDDCMEEADDPADFWQAYNAIAMFILSGKIRLQGGYDCMRWLAEPRPGVGVLHAGNGIFMQPPENISTFGYIKPKQHEMDALTVVTITPPDFAYRILKNRITLYKGKQYLLR